MKMRFFCLDCSFYIAYCVWCVLNVNFISGCIYNMDLRILLSPFEPRALCMQAHTLLLSWILGLVWNTEGECSWLVDLLYWECSYFKCMCLSQNLNDWALWLAQCYVRSMLIILWRLYLQCLSKLGRIPLYCLQCLMRPGSQALNSLKYRWRTSCACLLESKGQREEVYYCFPFLSHT